MFLFLKTPQVKLFILFLNCYQFCRRTDGQGHNLILRICIINKFIDKAIIFLSKYISSNHTVNTLLEEAVTQAPVSKMLITCIILCWKQCLKRLISRNHTIKKELFWY